MHKKNRRKTVKRGGGIEETLTSYYNDAVSWFKPKDPYGQYSATKPPTIIDNITTTVSSALTTVQESAKNLLNKQNGGKTRRSKRKQSK